MIVTWLFRPFTRIAGGSALIAGLVVLLASAVIAWLAGIHMDGVLDLHYGPAMPLWLPLLQVLLNWLLLAVVLLITGRLLSSTRFRTLDLFATQALARWPLLIGLLVLGLPFVRETMTRLTERLADVPLQEQGQVMADTQFLADAALVTAFSLPLLGALVWMIWLMYHGYALVCNLRGMRAVLSFIGALIVAYALSKVAYWAVYTNLLS